MSCEDYPTRQTAKTFKIDAETTNEVITLESDRTSEASDGKTKKTFWGIENDATNQLADIQQRADEQYSDINNQYVLRNKGDYVTDPLLESYYEFTDFNGSIYFPVVAPHQVDSATYPDPSNDPNLRLGQATDDSLVTASGSTTPRRLDDRFADVVNVRDFGAVGDGVTDDSDALIAAWRAATTEYKADKSTSDKSLYMPPGIYLLTEDNFLSNTGTAFSNHNRSIISGAGYGQTELLFRPNTDNAYLYKQVDATTQNFNGFEIKNMTVRLDGSNNNNNVNGFYCMSGGGNPNNQKFKFTDLYVEGTPETVWFEGGGVFHDDLTTTSGCSVLNIKSWLVFDNPESVAHKILGSTIANIYGFAFVVGSGGSIVMEGGTVQTHLEATNDCGMIQLGEPASSSPNAGAPFLFKGVRMELRSASSMILKSTRSSVRQTVVFLSCNFGNSIAGDNFAIQAVANKLRVKFDSCTLPSQQSSKYVFVDNPSPLVEYATPNAIQSIVTFENCRRFGGSDAEQTLYADFSRVTLPASQQGQVVLYENNLAIPNSIQNGCDRGSGRSYSPTGFISTFRGLYFPYSSDGLTPTNEQSYFNLEVGQYAFVDYVKVARVEDNNFGSATYTIELVDGVELNNPGTGVIYGELSVTNRDEIDWKVSVKKRLNGTLEQRTIWLRIKPGTISSIISPVDSRYGSVYAVIA
ncbi:pectin lyase fold/virulence factor [Vibrio phage 1.168.O._10N.261.52.A10]|nr:pectin lyase fold/virulence factor [Vibrio phage 1.168.O._10N.261.52.A10]